MKFPYACLGLAVLFSVTANGCRFFEYPGKFDNPYDPERSYVYDRTVGETAFKSGGGFCQPNAFTVSRNGSFCLVADRSGRCFRYIELEGLNATSAFQMENESEDPSDIDILPDGRTAVALVNGWRLFRMDISGLVDKTSTAPSNIGLLYKAENAWVHSVAADPDGSLWLLCRDNNDPENKLRLRHISSDGREISTIDSVLFSEGYDIGSFVVTSSHIYVPVRSNPDPDRGKYGKCIFSLNKFTGMMERQIYSVNGVPVTADTFFTMDTNSSFHPESIASVGYDGIAVSGWLDDHCVWVFDGSGNRIASYLKNDAIRDAGWSLAAADGNGTVYVAALRERRIIRSTDSAGLFRSRDLKPGEFLGISAIAQDSEGRLYVLDSQEGSVQRYDQASSSFEKIVSLADYPGWSRWNTHIALSGSELLVSHDDAVERFTPDGAYSKRMSTLNRNIRRFCPLSGGGMLCVLDDGSLIRLDASGAPAGSPFFIPTLSEREAYANGIFLHQAPDGTVWLAFTGIHGAGSTGFFSFGKLSADFTRYEEVGNLMSLPGMEESDHMWDDDLGSIFVSSSGFVWLAFQNRRIIAKFAPDGSLIGFLGSLKGGTVSWITTVSEKWYDWGLGAGRFDFPQKIAIDENDSIFVSDSNQIEIFRLAE